MSPSPAGQDKTIEPETLVPTPNLSQMAALPGAFRCRCKARKAVIAPDAAKVGKVLRFQRVAATQASNFSAGLETDETDIHRSLSNVRFDKMKLSTLPFVTL